ncbi:GNAT family N-acetyltransferase [Sporolactobacillus sp. THM19-2]|uniref:GNAT family N-acetyltransferase n=1 Tax=Sporolactobacillus sp. THM19-2 TaxID=2511171 RepID=UPI00101F6CA8|nr:GNAT family N-acetyltransferase [Sporolactobacillus sp. THM19-2]RYL86849.1 N-acetyltransferase [Sporolactobacillus sp. THM19-2]
MLIRDYKKEDEEAWLRCRVLSFLHTAYFDNVYQKKETYDHPSIELVAVESGKVIGLIDVEYESEPKSVCTLCSSRGGMIWHLAVHPDFQRQGIGAKLLAAVEASLKKLGIFELEAWTRDDPWVNDWYRKNGFIKVSSYLHVCIEAEEVRRAVHSSIAGLRPLGVFAYYSGDNTEKIRKAFHRVHECRGFVKKLNGNSDRSVC